VTPRAKTVYIEHPYDKDEDWKLSKTAKPTETTEQYYRFKVVAPPNSATQFAINEELPEITTFALSNITPDNIAVFVKSNYLTPQMKQSLEGIIDLKAQIAALARSIGEKQVEMGQIAKDQERMRENLRALGKTEEEKQLVQRYVAKLAQGEDQLERLRQEEQKLSEEKRALQRQLDERIRKLALEQRMG
jgi:regulator of replication initiation timing